MKLQDRIVLFSDLGEELKKALLSNEGEEIINQAKASNAWFSTDNIKNSLENIIDKFLAITKLEDFVSQYPASFFEPPCPQKIGIVAAGNIPLVGFQDLLHVVLCGHKAYIKLSSQDSVLISFVFQKLKELNPEIVKYIKIVDKLNFVDAYIATGSNNTARYFEYYFGKKPSIIRKNRVSVAVLNGNESLKELSDLGNDIFQYFGLGCRNVSKLFVPIGYDFKKFFESIEYWSGIQLHSKYVNNYDYNKSIFLVNADEHLDNGFLLLKKSDNIHSPIATLFYEEYVNLAEVQSKLFNEQESLQCVVSGCLEGAVKFGESQMPSLSDFADNIDTVRFLAKLSL